MDSLLYFTERTLLWIVAVLFVTGALMRALFFVVCISRSRPVSRHSFLHRCVTPLGIFVPFHRAFLKKPVYTIIRYAFHAGIFIVPIWFSGHVRLWEESRFEWYWTPLPDAWTDWMTLSVVAACAFFLVRGIVLKVRRKTGAADVLLILITGLPFLTGYLLTHGSLDTILFFENYLYHMHLITGEILLVTVIFLFVQTRLSKADCVGCAACVENCPTETLASTDKERLRTFKYSHYQCIGCGSCVSVCPESAAELTHAIGIGRFFQIFSKNDISAFELATCERCGVTTAPKSQIAKLDGILSANDVEMVVLNTCDRCKKMIGHKSALLPTA